MQMFLSDKYDFERQESEFLIFYNFQTSEFLKPFYCLPGIGHVLPLLLCALLIYCILREQGHIYFLLLHLF